MTTKTLDDHIVHSPDVLDGKPRIAGRGIKVANIVAWHQERGMSVADIADEYDLTMADVYAALAYYYDHQAEMDAQQQADDAFEDTLRRQSTSVVDRTARERVYYQNFA